MVLEMEGFYCIHALLVPQYVKLITKLLYIYGHFENQVINSYTHTHAGGKDFDHIFMCI